MNNFELFWLALAPEFGLAVVALLSLVLASTSLRKSSLALYGTCIVQSFWTLCAIFHISVFHRMVGGLQMAGLSWSEGTDLGRAGLLVVACILNWGVYFARECKARLSLEFPALVMAATVALMVLVASRHLGVTFVALESASLIGVALLACGRVRATAGALTYLMAAGLSAALLLWGVAFLYAQTGTLDYARLALALPMAGGWGFCGVALVLAGFAFKLGLFPLGYYLPAVYEKISYPALGFLATLSKAGAFLALANFLTGPLEGAARPLAPLIMLVGALTLVWGVLGALAQTNLKRLLALSGVVHAGLMTLALAAGLLYPVLAHVGGFYLAAYLTAMLAILLSLGALGDEATSVDSLGGLFQRAPCLGTALVMGFASLAGLPPMAGFVAKILVLFSAASARAWLSMGVIVVASVVALVYYLRVMRAVVTPRDGLQAFEVPELLKVILGSLGVLLVLLGLCQPWL
jgi:NADH-quinone oxidoreductase subunit N